MGEVRSITPASAAVDAAWERYRVLAAAAIDAPTLLLDRRHVQKLSLAESAFRRAFLASDRNVEGR